LKHKNYQNRTIGIIENGSWAPMAKKCMLEIINDMKNINICEPMVTIKTSMNDENIEMMKKLAKEIKVI
jgi:flavorubredoxin